MLNKKGSMFGLDARIALAIYRVLSVISRTTQYSTIKNSIATALLAQLIELGKEGESYDLNKGVLPDQVIQIIKVHGFIR